MVRWPHDAITIAPPITYYKHWQVMKTYVVTYLLQTTVNNKRRNTITKHFVTFQCHTRCNGNHILFSHSHIYKSISKNLLQTFQRIKANISRQENNTIILSVKLLYPVTKFFTHFSLVLAGLNCIVLQ